MQRQSTIDTVHAYYETFRYGGASFDAAASANSRIRDVDVAQATSEMTRNQILLQAGVSTLSQANQVPQIALKLLG